MPTLNTRLGKISYTREGQGKAIVFLHAAGHDGRDFDAVKKELRYEFEIVTFDWPGHGESGPAPEPAALRAGDLVPLFDEMATELQLKDMVLVGSSMGGYVAACHALKYPKKVHALVLVNSGGFNDPDLPTRLFCKLKGQVWATRWLWNLFPAFYVKKRNFYSVEILNRIRKRKSRDDLALNASLWRSFLDPDYDLRKSAKDITCPTLLLWGGRDPVIQSKIGRKIQTTISGSHFISLDTGHIPFAEDPAGFSSRLKTFLASLP